MDWLDPHFVNRRQGLIGSLALAGLAAASSAWAQTPTGDSQSPPLPAYFDAALQLDGRPFTLRGQSPAGGLNYELADGSALLVQQFACDRMHCRAMADRLIALVDEDATKAGGSFLEADDSGIAAEILPGKHYCLGLKTPSAVVVWWLALGQPSTEGAAALFDRIRSATDRWRSEQVQAGDGLDFGRWSGALVSYAQQLAKDGHRDRAVDLLRRAVTTNAGDLTAQMLFAEMTGDRADAKTSAQIVYVTAEDPDLRARAARFLGEKQPRLEDLPLLTRGDTGLQLILVPFPSCDIALVRDASRICETTLGLPVKMRRLETPPDFGAPDRVWRQRAAQAAILEAQGVSVDFTGWSKDRFAAALLEAAKPRSALFRFRTQAFIDDMTQRPGQFDAARCCSIWFKAVAGHRSADVRTMVVGVTDAGLFLGDTNYIFGAGIRNPSGGASLLSYQMMLTREVGDPVQSRQRLTQRLAKEMVPQALGQLSIPRPADPTDPYSSSPSVQATDAKSTTLSPATRDALAKFR